MDETATSKWAHKRQVIFISIAVVAFIALSAYSVSKIFYSAPSCFDGKQNGEELDVDCSGSCNVVCATEVEDIIVNWAQAFKVSDGVYDLAASIENPNYEVGAENLSYVFSVYDRNNILIIEKRGETFLNSRDKFVIFEPGVRTVGKVPENVVLEFEENIVWTKMETKDVQISIKNKKLLNVGTSPILNATLLNKSIDNISDVEIVAVVYNNRGDAVAVSSTYEETVKKNSSEDVFFTWFNKFTTRSKGGVCTAPADVVLVFDRSGSMGFAGANPPQPLTSAKDAASAFIDSVLPVDQVGLVSFATEASVPIDQNLTLLHEKVREAVESISIIPPAKDQHTNLGDGIAKAFIELNSERYNPKAKKAIVILTDGVASRPLNPENERDVVYPENYAREKAKEAQVGDTFIYVIGLGNSVNENFLMNDIAFTPSHYYRAASSEDLRGIYNEIALAVCEEETFITDVVIHVKNTDSVF